VGGSGIRDPRPVVVFVLDCGEVRRTCAWPDTSERNKQRCGFQEL
jgi:hypothetical protein